MYTNIIFKLKIFKSGVCLEGKEKKINVKAIFYPNFGKLPIEISSIEDIKRYYGKLMGSFDEIDIVEDKVLLKKGETTQYV